VTICLPWPCLNGGQGEHFVGNVSQATKCLFFFGILTSFCVMSHSHTSGQQNKHAPVFSFVHVFEKTLACGRPNTHRARVSPLALSLPPPLGGRSSSMIAERSDCGQTLPVRIPYRQLATQEPPLYFQAEIVPPSIDFAHLRSSNSMSRRTKKVAPLPNLIFPTSPCIALVTLNRVVVSDKLDFLFLLMFVSQSWFRLESWENTVLVMVPLCASR